jgi:hypothetical protein
MESEQRVIIKFLMNECVNIHEINTRLNAHFDVHTCTLRRIQFGCAVEKISMTSINPGDPLKITSINIVFHGGASAQVTAGVCLSSVIPAGTKLVAESEEGRGEDLSSINYARAFTSILELDSETSHTQGSWQWTLVSLLSR